MTEHRTIRRLAGLGVAAAVTAGTMLVTASPAQAAGAWVRVSAYHSGLVANVPAPWTTNGLQVEQRPYGANTYNGQWRLNPTGLGDQTFEFQNRYSNQCLDVENNSLAAGADVVQNPCDNTTSQQWTRWQDPSRPVWHVFNNLSGLYLAVENGSLASGADFVQVAYSAGDTGQTMQIW